MTDASLKRLVESTFYGPGCIDVPINEKRNAITALGVHCLFVKAGFVSYEVEPTPKSSSLQDFFSLLLGNQQPPVRNRPPDSWLALVQTSSEFVFRYHFPGKRGIFNIHCSVKPQTDQMLVRAAEEGNKDNNRIVGLLARASHQMQQILKEAFGIQVGYTVPEANEERLTQNNSWEGVLGDLNLLAFNVETYLIDPLLGHGVEDTSSTRSSVWSLSVRNPWLKYGALLVVLGFITHAFVQKRRQNM